MSKEEEDSKLPPLQLELDFGEEKQLQVGEITDPKVFEVGVNLDPEHQGVVILFPEAGYGMLFREEALVKFLSQVDLLLHEGLKSSPHSSFEEGAAGKKKVTLH